MRWRFKPYDLTYDLAAITLELVDCFDADAYVSDDPELATDLPAVWLKHAGASGLEDALAAIRATATIHGRLRPDASPRLACRAALVPYLDPYESCLMRLMRLLDVLGERG